MTPKELLQKLENLGSIESKVLRKIRIQVEDPERTVKNSAVLSYLVRKGQINEDQARQLMKGETPVVSRRATDELMLGVIDEEAPTASAEVVKPKRSNRQTVDDIPAAVPVALPMPEVELDPMGMDQFSNGANEEKVKPTFSGKKDKRDQWNSRWPYIGFTALGFLLMVGTFLTFALSGQAPEAMFNNARDHYNNSSYQAAIKAYDEYIEAFPSHKHIKEAKARRVQSLLRDSFDSNQWQETLNRATAQLPVYAEDEDVDMDRIRDDLGVMLTRSLSELTTGMLKNTELNAMQENLVKANKYKDELVDDPFYVSSSQRKVPTNKKYIDKLENNIRTIEGFIRKEKDYGGALVAIKSLGEEGKTEQAFKTFQDLTRQYGDLGARAELRELMVTTSALEARLVNPVDGQIETVTTRAPSIIEQTFVMGSIAGSPDEGLQGEVIPTLVGGSVLGFDAGTGEVVWRQFVGLGASIQPQKMGEEYVLVSDEGKSELLKLEIATGKLVWRVLVGEKFFAPALTVEKLVVTTATGKLWRLDPMTGETIGSAQLPQGANTRCFISEQDPLIYQAGLKSNLYVIGTEDMLCKEVFYTGHYSGSISVPPYMYNGHLIALVNGGDFCDMFVLRPKENGLNLGPDPVQVIRRVANGPVTRHLQRYGRWLLAVSDNGQMVILEFNQGDETTPISKFASETFESKEGQLSYIETDGNSLWVCGTGASFYKVKRNLGKFDLKVLKHGTDSFVAPSVKLDDKLFHVRRRIGSGMVSASLADANTLEPIWRNDFGGEVAGPVIAVGGTVGIVNGCTVKDGQVIKYGLPKKFLPRLQVVEYIRAFLMARLAASRKGTLAIISGAFGIFRRDIAVAIGGYDTTTVGEDMEMVLRMHRYMLERDIPYSVRYVPEPVCWTEAPESLKFLTNQRIRWQRGALECLSRHKSVIFNPKYGRLGMVTLPTFVLVDLISPVVEILGYLLMLIFVLLGWLDVRYFIALTALIFSFGVFVTTMSLLIEQDEIENFSNPLDLIKVLLTAFVENFGYRQLCSFWRMRGLFQHFRGKKASWGKMERVGFKTAEET